MHYYLDNSGERHPTIYWCSKCDCTDGVIVGLSPNDAVKFPTLVGSVTFECHECGQRSFITGGELEERVKANRSEGAKQ